jgi:Putative phage tail protein
MTGILGQGTNARQSTAAGSLQFQTSQAGGTIPLVYGATRVACNLLDYQGFTAKKVSGKGGGGGKSGGKGGETGKGSASAQYNYSASILLGICQGGGTTGVDFGLIWYDKNICPLFSLPGISHAASGGDGQGPDPYWITNFENDAIGYSGTAWFSADAYQLGSAPTLPNFSVEIFSISTSVNQSDANPRDIVVDFLTNDRYGAGYPAQYLDYTAASGGTPASGSIQDWGEYCDAVGIWLSPQLDQQTQAQQALANIAALTVSAIVWSGNLLKIIPYGDAPITATYWIIQLTGGSDIAGGDVFELTFSSPGLGTVTVSYQAQPQNVNTDTVDASGPMGQLAHQVNGNGNLTGYGISAGVGVSATVVRLGGADQSVTVTPSMGSSSAPQPGNETFDVIGPLVTSWTPDTTIQYTLDDDDFIIEESSVGTYLGVTPGSPALRMGAGSNTGTFTSDPVRVTRSSPADAMNYVQLECLDRAYSYNTQIVEVFDQGMVDLYGVRKDTSLKARAICDPALCGQTVANLTNQRSIAFRNKYEFSLGWQYCLLEPMDLVEIQDPYLGMSIVVRITSVAEDEEGVLNFTAEDFYGVAKGAPATPPAQASAKQGAAPTATVPYFNAPAPAAATPFVFEPPAALLQAQGLNSIAGASAAGPLYTGSPYVIVGLAGEAPLWGGAQIWVSLDGESYSQFGTFVGTSTMGVTDGALSPTFPEVDVDLTESGGELNSVSALAAANNITLFAVSDPDGANFELCSYETATLVSGNVYTLSGLSRGLYGTSAVTHESGSRFLYLGNGLYFSSVLPSQYAGRTLYLKFPGFNLVGGGAEALSAVPDYGYTVQGQQLNPNAVLARAPMAVESAGVARTDGDAPIESQ